MPDVGQMSEIMETAIDRVIAQDRALLSLGVTERALAHQVAVQLARLVPPGYSVDCEYNRHLEDIKRLDLPRRNGSDRELAARTVFPDIVVHKRNSDEFNLLVIELKKPGEDLDYDELKLRAFRRILHYQHAAHLILGVDGSGGIIRQTIWIRD